MQIQMMDSYPREVRSNLKPSFVYTSISESFFSSAPIPSLVAASEGICGTSSLRRLTTDTSHTILSSLHKPSYPNVHTNTPLVKPPGALSIIQSILRDNGLKGFWLGQTGTLLRDTGGTAAWFMIKEIVADVLRNRKHRKQQTTIDCDEYVPHRAEFTEDILLWESALAGAVAGGASTLLLYPADTVKSAIQTEEELRPSLRTCQALRPATFWRTASRMYRACGVSGFYAGCGMTVATSILSSGLIFVIYDGLKWAI